MTTSDASATYTSISNLYLKANLANPTFTGTLAAPTINATSALRIAGVDSGALFQQKPFVSAVIPVGTAGLVSGVVWSGSATDFQVSKLSGLASYRFQWTPAIPSTYVFLVI